MFESRGGNIAHNGKSICEGRAKLDEKFNFDRTKQIAFSDYQITKKSNMKSKLRLNATNLSTWFQPRLLQILCYATFFLIFQYFFKFFIISILSKIFCIRICSNNLFFKTFKAYFCYSNSFILLFKN